MSEYYDNFSEAAPQAHRIPDTNEPHLVPAIITAELALLDMLAHLIVDAAQRATTSPIVNDT